MKNHHVPQMKTMLPVYKRYTTMIMKAMRSGTCCHHHQRSPTPLMQVVGVWAALCACALGAPCPLPDGSEASLAALLRLRHGANCSRVSLQGLQQHAALLAAADAANAEAPAGALKIGVQVFDTCSEPDDAVKATLRALVANEGTCLQPPLFLGFVGPMDAAGLAAVQRVTRVFELPHVVAFGDDASTALPVTSHKPQQRTQALLSLVQRLGARQLVAVRAADATAARQAEDLLAAAKAANICVLRPPLDATGLSALHDVSNGTLVVVLSGESAELPLGVVGAVPSRLPLLVVGGAAGVLPATAEEAADAGGLRGGGAAPLLVLHDVAEPGVLKADTWAARLRELPLWHHYLRQMGADGEQAAGGDRVVQLSETGDASLVPVTYAVSLYAAAARAAQAARCRGSGPGPCAALLQLARPEWRATLAAVTAFARQTAAPARRLRFHMDLPAAADLLLWDAAQSALRKVGQLSGKQLSVSDEAAMAVPQLEVEPDPSLCYGAAPAPASAPRPATPVGGPEDPLAALLGDDYTYDQMVGLLAGVGVGMLAFFALCVYVVYSSFRVSSGKSDKQSNSSDSPRHGSSRRCRRRSSFTPRSSVRRGSD
ncbi:uncharacterized protein LOC126355330 [Schistocerca gregaria]|uniref:uncharacterized protein LOC126355330 n=1 Tax=Schistocerca gregaria TaxID=7010 RepID=UPI00211F305B|nr:uncharacterized protein LOC126355330 [Schistocerca gregaria]